MGAASVDNLLSVPSDNIERCMVLLTDKQLTPDPKEGAH